MSDTKRKEPIGLTTTKVVGGIQGGVTLGFRFQVLDQIVEEVVEPTPA